MKQHTGEEIRAIMAAMPAGLVAALCDAHREHRITEWEARWWGYLQFARTEAYEGESFAIRVNGTQEAVVQGFLPYVLGCRAAERSAGLTRRPWPDGALHLTG